MRAIRMLVVAATIGSVLLGADAALGASAAVMPKGGLIRIYVVPGSAQGEGTVVVVGAIGDYGKSAKEAGGYGKVTLQRGTFKVNLQAITKVMNNPKTIVFNTATCSYAFTGTAPATVSDGTGAYKGISGTLTLTETFAGYGPLYRSGAHKGTCNTSSNATPTALWGGVTGVGTVTFG